MDTGEWTDPISYFADGRLRPMVNLGVRRGELDKRDVELTERVIEALPDLMGRAASDKPARIHGDLWYHRKHTSFITVSIQVLSLKVKSISKQGDKQRVARMG